jgi:hypothetical protein
VHVHGRTREMPIRKHVVLLRVVGTAKPSVQLAHLLTTAAVRVDVSSQALQQKK